MPRCGHASFMAKTRPCKSRPTTSGVPNTWAFTNSLGPTSSPGNARYQKPYSHCESGACFSGKSLMRFRQRIISANVSGEVRMRNSAVISAMIFLASVFSVAKQPVIAHNKVSTFSIVARDPATGQMGIAVTSRYFSVGSVVPWAEAEVGAVATQADVNVGYGPEALTLLPLPRGRL